jgi:hypothetical protein
VPKRRETAQAAPSHSLLLRRLGGPEWTTRCGASAILQRRWGPAIWRLSAQPSESSAVRADWPAAIEAPANHDPRPPSRRRCCSPPSALDAAEELVGRGWSALVLWGSMHGHGKHGARPRGRDQYTYEICRLGLAAAAKRDFGSGTYLVYRWEGRVTHCLSSTPPMSVPPPHHPPLSISSCSPIDWPWCGSEALSPCYISSSRFLFIVSSPLSTSSRLPLPHLSCAC